MKHSILKTFAALMLTASFINYGADTGLNYDDITASLHPVTSNLPTFEHEGILVACVPNNDPLSEPILRIPNTTILPIVLTPTAALHALPTRLINPQAPHSGLKKLFIGQLGACPINQQEKVDVYDYSASLQQNQSCASILSAMQLLRVLNTLLKRYISDDETEENLLNSCYFELKASNKKNMQMLNYLHCPPEVAKLLWDIPMYIGRNYILGLA